MLIHTFSKAHAASVDDSWTLPTLVRPTAVMICASHLGRRDRLMF